MSRRQIAQRARVTPSTITRLARYELRLTRATALAWLATPSTRQSDSRPAMVRGPVIGRRRAASADGAAGRWAHMLGYRGHFATKSRRYSTTMRALRTARRDWRRRQHPAPSQQPGEHPAIRLTDLQWAGRGWRTSGDALLALSAAARAREHRRVAREEIAAAS